MEKYLFTDGTNVVREVQSKEELQKLIQSTADPAKIRIWVFNTSEWISLADYNKRSSLQLSRSIEQITADTARQTKAATPRSGMSRLVKTTLLGLSVVAAVFLVYNFSKVTWEKISPLKLQAQRPDNTPMVNVDSLLQTIENLRGIVLDKTTRTNLRIRNNWPDLLMLQLTAGRDSSRVGIKYYDLEMIIDNATGYNIDNAVVKWTLWKGDTPVATDTIHFSNIGYAAPAKKHIGGTHIGDSISILFSSIRSKSFNFCYSAEKKSNYGNYNDRWFCR